jgi:MtN3 and saliva related transmembrane protein
MDSQIFVSVFAPVQSYIKFMKITSTIQGENYYRIKLEGKSMGFFTILGVTAAFLTTFSFLPQTIKTIKEKNTEGISLLMYGMFTAGVFLWLLYGFYTKDIPVFFANLITLSFAITILTLKLKYR